MKDFRTISPADEITPRRDTTEVRIRVNDPGHVRVIVNPDGGVSVRVFRAVAPGDGDHGPMLDSVEVPGHYVTQWRRS